MSNTVPHRSREQVPGITIPWTWDYVPIALLFNIRDALQAQLAEAKKQIILLHRIDRRLKTKMPLK